MELDINRVAVTRNGRRCKILTLDRPSDNGHILPVVLMDLVNGHVHFCEKNGRQRTDGTGPFDIVSQEPAESEAPVQRAAKIDIKLPVKTRGGQDVVLLSDKAPGAMSLVGHLKGDHALLRWHPDGMSDGARDQQSPLDLVQERSVWVRIQRHGLNGLFADKPTSDGNTIAIVKVPYVEGQLDA